MPLLLGTAVVNGVRHVAHSKRKEAAVPEAEGNGGEEQVSGKPSKPTLRQHAKPHKLLPEGPYDKFCTSSRALGLMYFPFPSM